MSPIRHIFPPIVAHGIIPFALMMALSVAVAGCKMLGWNGNGFAHAWDELRCDRRVAVFVNLCLDTEALASYNSALAYLYSRNVSEVVFSGRTTAHGALAEFRALNAGFSSIPDPAHKNGRVKITWTVPRTYHFATEDAQGKYHPRTFWPRIFGTEWSDAFIASPVDATSSSRPHQDKPTTVDLLSRPTFLLYSYYDTRCHIQQFAYVIREEGEGKTKKTISAWEALREWDEDNPPQVSSWQTVSDTLCQFSPPRETLGRTCSLTKEIYSHCSPVMTHRAASVTASCVKSDEPVVTNGNAVGCVHTAPQYQYIDAMEMPLNQQHYYTDGKNAQIVCKNGETNE